MNHNRKQEEIIVLADLLKKAEQQNLFNQSSLFPVLNKTKQDSEQIKIQKQEYVSQFNEYEMLDVLKRLQANKTFGDMFEANTDLENEILFYLPSLEHTSKKIKFVNTEQADYIQHLSERDDGIAIKTFSTPSEFVEYLFGMQYSINAESKYIAFLKHELKIETQEITDNISQDNVVSENLIQDSIYDFMVHNAIKSGNRFYVQDVGIFKQSDGKWVLMENSDISIPLDQVNDFIKQITLIKVFGTKLVGLDQYEQNTDIKVKIDKDIEFLINKHTSIMGEINDKRNQPVYEINTTGFSQDEFDFQNEDEDWIDYHQTTEVESDDQIGSNDYYDNYEQIIDLISHTPVIQDISEINEIQEEYWNTVGVNVNLENQLSEVKEQFVDVSDVDEINLQLALAAEADTIDYSKMGLDQISEFLYQPEEVDNQNIAISEEVNYNDSLWGKLNSYPITTEAFLNSLAKIKFRLPVTIMEHDGKVFFKRRSYVFESRATGKSIPVAAQGNRWYMFSEKQKQGNGISDLIKTLYQENNIIIQEKQATPYIEFLDENLETIQLEQNKLNKLQSDMNELHMNAEKELEIINKEKRQVDALFQHFKDEYMFVAGIQSVEKKVRNNKEKDEFTINGKIYRMQNDIWFCINTKNTGSGTDSLINDAYPNPNEANRFINSINNFIRNKIIRTEYFLSDYKKAIIDDPDADTSIVDELITNEEKTDVNVSVNTYYQQSFNSSDVEYDFYGNPIIETDDLEQLVYSNQIDSAHNDNVIQDIGLNNDNYVPVPNESAAESERVAHTESADESAAPVQQSDDMVSNKEPEGPVEQITQEYQEIKLDEQSVLDDFEKLVELRYNDLISKRHIVDNFKASTLLEIFSSFQDFYPIQAVDSHTYAYGQVANNNYFTIDKDEFKKGSLLLKKICSYTYFEFDDEMSRIGSLLIPILKQKIRQQLKLELEQQQTNLLQEEIKEIKKLDISSNDNIITDNNRNEDRVKVKNNINIDVLQDKHADVHAHSILEQDVAIETVDPQKEFELMIGLDANSIASPIKRYLYEYFLIFHGKVIRAEASSVMRRLIKKTPELANKNIEVTSSKTHDKQTNDRTFTIKSDVLEIKALSNNSNEKWEIVRSPINSNVPYGNQDSLIDMFKYVFRIYGLELSNTFFNYQIAQIKENTFFIDYPMDKLFDYFDVTYEGKDIRFGDMKIGILDRNDGFQNFRIWNYSTVNRSSNSAIKLLQCLMAYEMGLEVSDENIENHPELTFGKTKDYFKKLYFSLDNLQKISLGSGNRHAKTDSEKDADFERMLPKTSTNSKALKKYLISRGISPQAIDELNGKAFYQGEYDKYRNNQPFTVVAFSNGNNAISVRGCTPDSSNIKETVPGSRLDKPYVIYPSKEYAYKDDVLRWKMCVFEGAIDALSYHCLYPTAIKFTNFGLTGSKLIIDALQQFDKVVDDKKGDVQIVYAMDNINFDENGEVIDKASRGNYFKIVSEMSNFCYKKFLEQHSDAFQQFEYTNDHLVEVVIKLLQEDGYQVEQINELEAKLNHLISQTNEELSINHPNVVDELGHLLFKFIYLDTGRFIIESAQHDKYGQYKDWNELLENMVYIKLGEAFTNNTEQSLSSIKLRLEQQYKQPVDISSNSFKAIGKVIMKMEGLNKDEYSEIFIKQLEKIHDELIYEMNDNIINAKVKRELKKQQKVATASPSP